MSNAVFDGDRSTFKHDFSVHWVHYRSLSIQNLNADRICITCCVSISIVSIYQVCSEEKKYHSKFLSNELTYTYIGSITSCPKKYLFPHFQSFESHHISFCKAPFLLKRYVGSRPWWYNVVKLHVKHTTIFWDLLIWFHSWTFYLLRYFISSTRQYSGSGRRVKLPLCPKSNQYKAAAMRS